MDAMIETIKKHIARLPQGDPGRAALASLATDLVLNGHPAEARLDVKEVMGRLFILVSGGRLTEGTIERLAAHFKGDSAPRVVILESEHD